jgi:hypothetical protein
VTAFDPSVIVFGAYQSPESALEGVPIASDPIPPDQLPPSVDLTAGMPPVVNQAVGSLQVTSGLLPAIGNQGSQGSCVAWAAGYCVDTYVACKANGWTPSTGSHTASPAYLYARAGEKWRLYAGSWSCGSGTAIVHAMEVLEEQGCSALATVPYNQYVCVDPHANQGDAASFQIDSFASVNSKSRTSVKSQVAAGNPVVFGADIYSNFMSWSGSAVYNTASGSYLGGHAMAVVGYDDARQAFRIQNSWGTGWGDLGYMWMGYAVFEQITRGTGDTFIATKGGGNPPASNNPPTITSLVANPTSVIVSRTSSLTAAASDPDGDGLTWQWSATGGTLVRGTTTATWTAPATAGTYTVRLTVSDGKGGSDTESVSITATPAQGGEVIVIN